MLSTNGTPRSQTHLKSLRPVSFSLHPHQSSADMLIAASLTSLRREFLQEESDARKHGVTYLHETTPMTFLRRALDVEEKQYVYPSSSACTALIHWKGEISGHATGMLPQVASGSRSPSRINGNPLPKRSKNFALPSAFICRDVLSPLTTLILRPSSTILSPPNYGSHPHSPPPLVMPGVSPAWC